MPAKPAPACAVRESVEALAHDRHDPAQRAALHRHLERCESCRTVFRRLTSAWFPQVRNYTVLEQVGKGGFGVVYKAINHQAQRVEALKVHFGTTPLRTAYFENEVRLIAQLRHPNIATLYSANLGGSPPYYTMEFVEGRQLDDYFTIHQSPLVTRLRVLRDVAAAVGYAHSCGVVHRDLKPQNILVDADGHPCIVDFGIAKRLGLPDEPADAHDARPGEGMIGTFGYIAPEQAAGLAVDARADVYALGALLFHCITGDPARFASHTDRLALVFRDRGVDRSADLAAVITRCVATDPARRYADCAALIADLDSYLASGPVAAREHAPFGYRFARGAAYALHQHPFAVRGVLVAGVALAMAQFIWALKIDHTPAAHSRGEPVVLVGFTGDTRDAIRAGRIGPDLPGLDAANTKSWRLLHGRFMERLARGQPRVVAWDYYFPDEHAAFDPAFVAGTRALQAPVIVGSRDFDVNNEPRVAPAIRAAVRGAGLLIAANPNSRRDSYVVPLALVRGFGPPVPSLALATLAAFQFPHADPQLVIGEQHIELRYQKRSAAPGEARWHTETDELPIFDRAQPAPIEGYSASDRLVNASVPARDPQRWRERMIPYEAVLQADDEQLRRWFAGRAVLVGQLLPNIDQMVDAQGRALHGCQVHAAAIEALLLRTIEQRLTRPAIALRAMGWCAAAALLAAAGSALTARLAPRVLAALCVLVATIGLAVTGYAALQVSDRAVLEGLIAAGALLTCGGPALLAETIRRRQQSLAPGPVWKTDPSTVSSTLVAPTR
ncbi:MAG: protein kinase [Phycisphaerae bacterium]